MLYSHIARQYIPAPKANFVKVVINGESWGVYANVQQFNKEFLEENFKTRQGHRWKVARQPRRRRRAGVPRRQHRGLQAPLRDQVGATTRRRWKALDQPVQDAQQDAADKLEEALKPILDVDGLLWFLALDVALINSDGYWIRASDYSLYRDEKGKFHIIPHDMNEAFRGGMGGGPGGGASSSACRDPARSCRSPCRTCCG